MTRATLAAVAAALLGSALLVAGCGGSAATTVTETVPVTTAATTTVAVTTTVAATTTAALNPAQQPIIGLQKDLATLGFSDGAPSGTYDAATTQAVRDFQRRAGLPVDGIVGPQTEAAINLALGNDSTDAVELLQTTLTGLCQYSGKIDGVFGSGTEAALKAFQEQQGITADGRYGPATAVALADAWPNRPASCNSNSGTGGGNATGDVVTVGSPAVAKTFDLQSCIIAGGGVAATGTAVGGYRISIDTPGGPGGNVAISGGGLNLNGNVDTVTITKDNTFRATGSWKSGPGFTLVGTCT